MKSFRFRRSVLREGDDLGALLGDGEGQKRTVHDLEALLNGLEAATKSFLRIDGLDVASGLVLRQQCLRIASARSELGELRSFYDRGPSVVPSLRSPAYRDD